MRITIDEYGRATVQRRRHDMTKKTASKVGSKARSEKRAFSAAVRGLRQKVAANEMDKKDAVAQRQAWLDGEALPT